jgi:hypothetical protein
VDSGNRVISLGRGDIFDFGGDFSFFWTSSPFPLISDSGEAGRDGGLDGYRVTALCYRVTAWSYRVTATG